MLRTTEQRFDRLRKRIVRRHDEQLTLLGSIWQGLTLSIEGRLEKLQQASGGPEPAVVDETKG
jgi:hypothetical protein